MIKTIDLRRDEVARGVVLRHASSLFDGRVLRYDTERPASLCEIVVGEIDDPVTEGFVEERADGCEQVFHRDGRLVFTRNTLRRGLIAIPIGNRYALKCITGGLENPIDRRPNGEVVGGTTITNLACGNVAGFVNWCLPPDRPLTHIRVLGTVVNTAGRPVSLRDFVETPRVRNVSPPYGVLVGGAGMETGKTTFCLALFRALRGAAGDVRYIKATGTSCFISDPLRVQAGDMSVLEHFGDEFILDPRDLRVSDFVDACGVPTDVSTDHKTFTRGTCRYLDSQTGEVCITELADSLHHRTNLALLRSPLFRSHFGSLVYVVDPSLDAAQNFNHFIRDVLVWSEVRLAFAGPLATAPEHALLRAEIHERLGIRCLDQADEDSLLAWLAQERATAP